MHNLKKIFVIRHINLLIIWIFYSLFSICLNPKILIFCYNRIFWKFQVLWYLSWNWELCLMVEDTLLKHQIFGSVQVEVRIQKLSGSHLVDITFITFIRDISRGKKCVHFDQNQNRTLWNHKIFAFIHDIFRTLEKAQPTFFLFLFFV